MIHELADHLKRGLLSTVYALSVVILGLGGAALLLSSIATLFVPSEPDWMCPVYLTGSVLTLTVMFALLHWAMER